MLIQELVVSMNMMLAPRTPVKMEQPVLIMAVQIMNVFALKDMLAKIVKVNVYICKDNVGPVLVRFCQTCPIYLCVRSVPNTQM